MATNTTKNTKPKTTIIQPLENNIDASTSYDVRNEDASMTEKKPKRKFEQTDPILCVSITSGELGMIGLKTGVNYTWAGRNDETEVEYQDLVAAIRSGKSHITKPYFIIKDRDFLAEFPKVADVYKNMFSIEDLQDVLIDLDARSMIATIKNLPQGAQDSILNIAATLISNNQIDSVSKIKALDEYYNTKFMLMTELFN